MVRYVGTALNTAGIVGEVEEMELRKASKYLPDMIHITGATEDGRKYELTLTVGETKNEDA